MKKRKILAVIFLLLFVGTLGILLVMANADDLTEQNTESLVATVADIRITDIKDGNYIDIYIEEYDTSLFISTKLSEKIDFSELQKGEKIVFRIESKKVVLFGKADFIDIVSLESGSRTYFSLSDYNTYTKASIMPARISAMVLATVFLFVAVCFLCKRDKK